MGSLVRGSGLMVSPEEGNGDCLLLGVVLHPTTLGEGCLQLDQFHTHTHTLWVELGIDVLTRLSIEYDFLWVFSQRKWGSLDVAIDILKCTNSLMHACMHTIAVVNKSLLLMHHFLCHLAAWFVKLINVILKSVLIFV